MIRGSSHRLARGLTKCLQFSSSFSEQLMNSFKSCSIFVGHSNMVNVVMRAIFEHTDLLVQWANQRICVLLIYVIEVLLGHKRIPSL
jgi:hypothetical protein